MPRQVSPTARTSQERTTPPSAARTGTDTAALQQAVAEHLRYSVGRLPAVASDHDYYRALALAVRDRMQDHWTRTTETHFETGTKIACYLSAEFLLGPHLGNNLLGLDMEEAARTAITNLGRDFDTILSCEEEPGLGNGGLGRLAACYLDSLATLQRPAIGYGIRYEFGIFDQEIRDGWQAEVTDKWLRYGNPWEIAKPEIAYYVNWGGYTRWYRDEQGAARVEWVPHRVVKGTAYDTPIQGYRVGHCNTLRLWSAEAVESFDFQAFNLGDYYKAVEVKLISETITKVLYPNDEPEAGKRLRLAQQYFFTSCSLQDMLHMLDIAGLPVTEFGRRYAAQLNDTHPSIAVAELMRLLIDERHLDWDAAWAITIDTFAYTNHTLLPEALETWPVHMFETLLPRHLEIVYEINQRFLDEVRARYPGDEARARRLSLIAEGNERSVRMAHLAAVGSHLVNGVAALHSELLKTSVLKDFYELWPGRFTNVTNGVTPRRFVTLANPPLRALLDRTIGQEWPVHLESLRNLEPYADEEDFRREWRAIRHANKRRLADDVRARTGVELNPEWMFDVQVKRIHEYKRQHLSALHIVTLYQRLKKNPALAFPARAFLFGGKAAPGYRMAKLIIRLITGIADVVNADAEVNTRIKVVFLPNFNVQNAQAVYAAADLSEQISTAGKEASGTGNMKFMMNGALTIGTLDGANVEIREEAGAENFFLFGLTASAVEETRRAGYRPGHYLETNSELRDVMALIASGAFSNGDPAVFAPLVENLEQLDPFLVLADYAAYVACQEDVSAAWRDVERWTRMSILNTARSGKFSSDRSIREYCDDIWQVQAAEHGNGRRT